MRKKQLRLLLSGSGLGRGMLCLWREGGSVGGEEEDQFPPLFEIELPVGHEGERSSRQEVIWV